MAYFHIKHSVDDLGAYLRSDHFALMVHVSEVSSDSVFVIFPSAVPKYYNKGHVHVYGVPTKFKICFTLTCLKLLYSNSSVSKANRIIASDNFSGLLAVIFKFLSFKFDTIILFEVQGDIFKFPNNVFRFHKSILIKISSYLVVFFSDNIRVVDPFLLPSVASIVDRRKVKIIPPRINKVFFKNINKPILNVKTEIRFLFVGSLSASKNVETLIRAFAQLEILYPSHCLYLSIVGDGEKFRDLVDLSRDLNLKNIKFWGRMQNEDLINIYQGHDIFVLPSVDEGFGKVLIEASLLGCVLIGSNVGGIPSVIKNNYSGLLVPPMDVNALISSMSFFLDHPSEIIRQVSNSQQFILRNFDQKRIIDDYMDFMIGK